MVNDDPSSDIFVVGAHTCGNSGLCRLYVTDSVGEQKIVKISVVGNIARIWRPGVSASAAISGGFAGVLPGHRWGIEIECFSKGLQLPV